MTAQGLIMKPNRCIVTPLFLGQMFPETKIYFEENSSFIRVFPRNDRTSTNRLHHRQRILFSRWGRVISLHR
jgi:hypothetical protein